MIKDPVYPVSETSIYWGFNKLEEAALRIYCARLSNSITTGIHSPADLQRISIREAQELLNLINEVL